MPQLALQSELAKSRSRPAEGSLLPLQSPDPSPSPLNEGVERKLGGYDFWMLWIGLIDSKKCRGSIDEINVDILDLEGHLDISG
ncbi:hypothetical protein [Bradyrhizobium sp. USDA 313]|uniref:hypothetical protein n=1 Tax=Bradyrhizobium sp. USDA 313 TaxID=3156307 RepID=UPI003511AC7C